MRDSEYGLRAADLRHRIQIQQPTDAPNGQGGATRTWTTITDGACYAAIEPASAREQYSYQQLQLRVTHRITVRFVNGVTGKMRVLFGTRIFNVRSVRNINERNKVLVLLGEEGVPG